MVRQLAANLFQARFFQASLFAVCLFLSTCGIEEYYFLPQVPQTYITTELNTSASINLPSISGYYYAKSYKIYYKIYISNSYLQGITINTSALRTSVSTALENDYNAIYPNTDPTSNVMGTPANTLFRNRSYFELALDGVKNIGSLLSTGGGNVSISFPTAQGSYPIMSINNGAEIRLSRSKDLIRPPEPDNYFRNTSDLNDPLKAIANINADVASISVTPRYAYVSMYIVAEGTNPRVFTPIYSKPTHISVFKLPEN